MVVFVPSFGAETRQRLINQPVSHACVGGEPVREPDVAR
jgi:hypothetical protein